MITLDLKQGLARDHGEFWNVNADTPYPVVVDMMLLDDRSVVEFSFSAEKGVVILVVPMDRLKKLVSHA